MKKPTIPRVLSSVRKRGRRLVLRLPTRVLAPFDSYEVTIVDRLSYPRGVPLNKLCGMAEIENAEWRKALCDLDMECQKIPFHKKAWEFAHALYGLRKLERLPPEAVALGVASGHEPILYFLANKIRTVIATDIYQGEFAGSHGSPCMLDHPEMFAPFHYQRDHLRVLVMDARELEFPSCCFDFVFSFSSIEHFGGHSGALIALKEIYRVLKPGGVAVVTTELILNRLGEAPGFFRRREIGPVFLQGAGFDLGGGSLDGRIERRFVSEALNFPYNPTGKPCIVLRVDRTLFTSIALFLQKPPRANGGGEDAATGEESPHELRRYRHSAEMSSSVTQVFAKRGGTVRLPLMMRNAGDIAWFNFVSDTHTVRVGAHLLSAGGECLELDFARSDLPRTVQPGDEVRLDLVARAPGRSGDFIVEVDIVKEGVLWFGEEGSPTLRVPMRVT